jgi:hypothetical protein
VGDKLKVLNGKDLGAAWRCLVTCAGACANIYLRILLRSNVSRKYDITVIAYLCSMYAAILELRLIMHDLLLEPLMSSTTIDRSPRNALPRNP